LRRHTLRGLSGAIQQYNDLPQSAQLTILHNIKLCHPALRECGRARDPQLALTAIKLIALGRQGRLAYVLSEALHGADEDLSRAAVEAIVALSRWCATETRKLQKTGPQPQIVAAGPDKPQIPQSPDAPLPDPSAVYHRLMEERPDIEQAVARALDVHRGKHTQDLLRAALLLADSPASRTFAILNTTKHGGQTAMIRRLQQPPDSEHVEAFLLGASHGGLRAHFGVVFSHIADAPVLDALLRKTHWLKDQQLQLCMHQVSRGVWWTDPQLDHDLARRDDEDAARIAEWIAVSATHDVVQDERLDTIRLHLANHFPARLRLLRIAMRRPLRASVALVRSFLADPDERLLRLAAREIVRRRPTDFENMLLHLMTSAPESVRRVITRSVGQVGFDHFWERFDRLDRATRKVAGRAMLKILPDGLDRLERRLRTGPVEQRIKAISIVHELSVGDQFSQVLIQLCHDPNPKVRSKAVVLLAEIKSVPPDTLLEKILTDSDPRVRANAIEVLEAKHRLDFVPLLAERARSAPSRERANAIKALHRMRVGTASSQLGNMLRDDRPEHRISALWSLKQIGWWQMFHEVGRLAKEDPNTRVRRYAMAVLRSVAQMLHDQNARNTG
jgi:hypothetical protein